MQYGNRLSLPVNGNRKFVLPVKPVKPVKLRNILNSVLKCGFDEIFNSLLKNSNGVCT